MSTVETDRRDFTPTADLHLIRIGAMFSDRSSPRSASLILAAAFAVAACGSSSTSPDGTGGTTTGGISGTGGGANTGGGTPTGGTTGTGGKAGADAGMDAGGSPSAFLDDCFAGLRAFETQSQLSDRRSGDGAYRVRLAIEYPPGSVGTSGTIPWDAVRVGIVTPQKQVCIKDEAALKDAYKGSVHNCSDSLVVMSDGLIFTIKPPDVATVQRPVTTLAVTGAAAIPAVMLPNVTCTGTKGAQCVTGGPCQ